MQELFFFVATGSTFLKTAILLNFLCVPFSQKNLWCVTTYCLLNTSLSLSSHLPITCDLENGILDGCYSNETNKCKSMTCPYFLHDKRNAISIKVSQDAPGYRAGAFRWLGNCADGKKAQAEDAEISQAKPAGNQRAWHRLSVLDWIYGDDVVFQAFLKITARDERDATIMTCNFTTAIRPAKKIFHLSLFPVYTVHMHSTFTP